MAFKESITCNICGNELERISANTLHDRKPYFGIKRYIDEKPGEVQVESIANCEIGRVAGAEAHLCGYICLNAWWSDHISKQLNNEINERKKKTKEGEKKNAKAGDKEKQP